jgi:glycosyltransferase involved in cell wall biosynthesis
VTAAVQKLGLADTVTLLGRRHDVPVVLRAADALLLVSQQEGLPNVLLEAQYCERPVVSTRVGGAAECLVEDESGFLRDADDVAGLAEACARLLRDPELGARMGRKGREFVSAGFTLPRMVDATLGLYA